MRRPSRPVALAPTPQAEAVAGHAWIEAEGEPPGEPSGGARPFVEVLRMAPS